MGDFTDLSACGGYSGSFPMLPPFVLASAQELHQGKLCAWTPAHIECILYLAIAAANLPGVRTVKTTRFESQEEAEFAAIIHNENISLSSDTVRRIVESARTAEVAYLESASELVASCERH